MSTFQTDSALRFINPEFLTPLTQRLREVFDPATLQPVGRVALCDEADVQAAIDAANAAQKQWRQVDAKSRAARLHQLANTLEQSLECNREVARLMTLEMGKPFPEAMGELANCAPIFRYYAEMARDDAGKVAGTTQIGSFQHVRYEPYGVSVHIMPFNFPILLMCWTVAASLAAGNACIIKPAEATTLCTLKFMEHFTALLPGLVSCVPGDGSTAQLLIQSPGTHAVAFTGSVAAGQAVAVACAQRMKPAVIEAGGSDPLIISKHAPLEVAAAGAVTAAFHLSGQICTSAERFFVVDEIHDAFVARFAERTRALRIGHGLERSEIGPMVSKAARDKVMRLVDDAVAKGATLVCGGRIPPEQTVGWFYEPTILTGVTADMAILQEECFGPVAAICRVSDFDEAIRLANDSPFGLGASLFSTDLEEAMEAADRLEAGMVWVNNPLIDNDALPFGGWKMSGLGRELGRQGLEAFRRSKMVIIDHKPQIQDWWYPYSDEVFYR
ncbi:Acyl-CoA reductase [Pseudomonas sp. ok272]|uniref:aldehyde dehydrogenase family protein n=1 Tax=unclassified Pseudomonas TaxID=196821 RepID=UPI0008D5E362|nr:MULTISPECIES: aldehyde dehydrogenase family protein [unclassified Pseudomonas]SEM44646.1 Acyl-CoA reductase [Pseudomonas sp. ok272]SFM16500.1 Acyl-CoA reductase [Pseudomonas sp. ok602]